MDKEYPWRVAGGILRRKEYVGAASWRFEGRIRTWLIGGDLVVGALVCLSAVPLGTVTTKPAPDSASYGGSTAAATVDHLPVHAAVRPAGAVGALAAVDAPDAAGEGGFIRHRIHKVLLPTLHGGEVSGGSFASGLHAIEPLGDLGELTEGGLFSGIAQSPLRDAARVGGAGGLRSLDSRELGKGQRAEGGPLHCQGKVQRNEGGNFGGHAARRGASTAKFC
mmetsp:Transcript_6426/g.19442  ORF Transcript_6426/g.19442 Transcript_6426/m.19442 type:complete len:222 (-) Transcript_6426:39-704(-)